MDRIFICEEDGDGKLAPISELERGQRERVKSAFEKWLHQHGKPNKKYTVLQWRMPAVTVKEVKRKEFVES